MWKVSWLYEKCTIFGLCHYTINIFKTKKERPFKKYMKSTSEQSLCVWKFDTDLI